ncbi:hypothetical protein M9Y10_024053 [Tritrichomonas musculus]|uniref:non-specific serine/threonine protein kinase n=1 Tax=Tritrichomonas musculus TaxID=1915356 RepID=A0ABR2KWT9_9EUKA
MKKSQKDQNPRRKKDKECYIPKIPDLVCQKLIGSGHFSSVFRGSYKGRSPVSIKIIDTNHDSEILKEIRILQRIKGCPHTINIIEALKIEKNTNKIVQVYTQEKGKLSTMQIKDYHDTNSTDNDNDYDYYSESSEGFVTILIIDYIEAMSLHHFYHHVKLKYFQRVLKDIFESLASVHSKNVVHRDITENNVLVTPDFKHGFLIDWGCSTIIEPNKPLRPNSGSRQFRSPEMLFNYKFYDTKCDIWSVGVYILSVLCGHSVPWRTTNPRDVLLIMFEFYGNKPFLKLASDLNISLNSVFGSEFIESTTDEPTKAFEDCFSKKFKCLQHPLLISLMKDLLRVDPKERPTAEAVLNHEFFSSKFH